MNNQWEKMADNTGINDGLVFILFFAQIHSIDTEMVVHVSEV